MELMKRRRELMQQQELPSAYRRVEYLQTDGNQYITNIPTTFTGNDIYFYCKYKIASLKNYGPHIFSTAGNTFWLVNRGMSTLRTLFQINGLEYGYSDVVQTNAEIIAKIENGYATIGGGEAFEVPAPAQSNLNCAVFTYMGSAGSATVQAPTTIYALTLRHSDGTGINLIPCVRKSDSVAGMYDTVSHTFYTNAGTGSFIIPT